MFSASPPPQPPINAIYQIINTEDWSDFTFSRRKAYVCAVLSEVAYWHLPTLELAGHDRVKVVPSSAYQQLVSFGPADQIWEQLRQRLEMPATIIPRTYGVALVMTAPRDRVIFVAIRGTAAAYDWTINADLRRTPHLADLDTLQREATRASRLHGFHRGFYIAASELFTPVLDAIGGRRVPVYIVGHSLGGAMAAIFHALHSRTAAGGAASAATDCAYTFGMPRYADRELVATTPAPLHVLKADDIVPRVPPTWLGFANPRREYRVDGTQLDRGAGVDLDAAWRWSRSLVTTRAVREHFIEGYRLALA